MVCRLHSHYQFFVALISYAGGVLLNVFSIICLVTNTSMDQSLRGILLSFSMANVIGTCMLTYDTYILICHDGQETSGLVATITVMLSVSHLMLLMLAEYLNLNFRWALKITNFVGLIFISWIISVTLGSLNVVSIRDDARVIFAGVMLLLVVFILVKYYYIFQQQRKEKRLQKEYIVTFLRGNSRRHKTVKCYWNIKYMPIILLSYAACSIPWVINEFLEGFQEGEENIHMHSISLIAYSFNFYFPSIACIHLKYKQWITKRRRIPQSSYISTETNSLRHNHNTIKLL